METTESLSAPEPGRASAEQLLEMLEVRWLTLAEARDWHAALELAGAIIQLAPDKPTGWLWQSRCLSQLHRRSEAWERLAAVADRFPDVAILHYDLACYACKTKHLPEARRALQKAFSLGNSQILRTMAAQDEALRNLWT